MLKNLIEERFADEWDIIDRDTDVFLVEKSIGRTANKERAIRRVISFTDNEEGEVFIEAFDVPGLLDQEEETIDFMLGYSFSEEEIEAKKEELRRDKINSSDNNILMYCELQSHQYGEFVGSEVLFLNQSDVEKWYNSELIADTLEFYMYLGLMHSK